jgi:hypothetical protein
VRPCALPAGTPFLGRVASRNPMTPAPLTGSRRYTPVAATICLACVSALGGCESRYADAVVANYTSVEDPSTSGGGGSGAEVPNEGSDGPSEGGGKLCEACTENADCGGRGDHCVTNLHTDEVFCGRACEDDRGCPQHYRCSRLENDHERRQCVPETGSCANLFGDITREGSSPAPEETWRVPPGRRWGLAWRSKAVLCTSRSS